MDQPDRGAERHFAQPYRQMVTMLLVLALVGAGAYLAYPQVAPVFLANPYLNGFIAFVFTDLSSKRLVYLENIDGKFG